MDRKEAVEWIEKAMEYMGLLPCEFWIDGKIGEAIDLAIVALQGDLHCPKCGTIVRDGRQYHDLVYRGEAEPIKGNAESATTTDCNDCIWNTCNYNKIDWEVSEDCISRQAAVDAIHCDIEIKGTQNARIVSETIAAFVDRIKALPSVEPVHGEWLHEELIPNTVEGHVHGECSVCHAVRIVDNYCPNCGAKMGGDTE